MLILLLTGTLGMLGHSMVTNAHRFAEASVLAPSIYSQMMFIAVLSWLVFSKPPDRKTIPGTLIIAGSGIFIWFLERQIRPSSN